MKILEGHIFRKPTEREWLALIEKELKNENLSVYHRTTFDQVVSTPFVHQDHALSDDHFIELNEVSPSTRYLPRIEVHNIDDANKCILQELMNGAGGVELHIYNGDIKWNDLFVGVYLELVTIHVYTYVKQEDLRKSLNEFIAINGISNTLDILCFTTHFRSLQSQKETRHFDVYQDLVYSEISLDSRIVENGAEILNRLADLIDKRDYKDELRLLFCRLGFTNDFIGNIAAVKALRSVIHMVLQANDFSRTRLVMHGYVADGALSEDEYTQMIANTSIGLGANLAQLDSYTLPIQDDSKENRRIAANIQNILEMETHVNETKDPLSGAYRVDNLALSMANAIWTRFLSLRER